MGPTRHAKGNFSGEREMIMGKTWDVRDEERSSEILRVWVNLRDNFSLLMSSKCK